MNYLSKYEEDLYKCSRCGLCQSVCPVYKATLNECAVSKGKFNMLNGLLKGDLKFTPRLKYYLDMCTGCNACKEFCPSDIDARKIFFAAKCDYHLLNENKSFCDKIFNSYTFFKFLLFLAKPCFKLWRLLRFDLIVNLVRYPMLFNNYIGKKILLLNSLIGKNFYCQKRDKKALMKALYFDGCFNKYINPETENAVKSILFGCDIQLVKKNFECCGVSFLNDGNLAEFQKIIQKNLSVIDCEYDYILTDCASCQYVLSQYKDFCSDGLALEVSSKLINVLDLIQNIKFSAKSNFNVAIHLPCHEKFDLKSMVKNISNISFIDVEYYDMCCGFSGTFAVKNNDISVEISKTKAKKYLEQDLDFVLTTCPACVLGLEQGFIEAQSPRMKKPKVMNLFVFLAKYCNIDGFIS